MKRKVSASGQVVIPKPLRDRLGIGCGTLLEFTMEGDRLIAVSAGPPPGAAHVFGCLGKNFDTDRFIETIRGRR